METMGASLRVVKYFACQVMNAIRIKFSRFPWIYTFILGGCLLRISGFTVGSIWFDEMFSLQVAHLNMWDMIQALKVNISPPGFEILLWFALRIFGYTAFGLRIFSVIASVATLWVTYKITQTLKFSYAQQIASLAIIATLPHQLIMAQQGRIYAIFTLLYFTGMLAAMKGRWILLGMTITGMLWSHNISFMYIPGLLLIALITYPHAWKKILITGGLAGITYLPWITITLQMAGKSMPWFIPLTMEGFLDAFRCGLFGFDLPCLVGFWGLIFLILLWTVALVIPLVQWILNDLKEDTNSGFAVFVKKQIKNHFTIINSADGSFIKNGIRTVLFISHASPVILLTLASQLGNNVLIYRTIFPMTGALILWLVYYYVPSVPNIFHKCVWAITIFISMIGVITWSPSQLGGGMEHLVNMVENELQPGDVFYHDTGLSAIVFEYYFPHNKHYLMDGENVLGLSDIKTIHSSIQSISPTELSAERVWVVWTHAEDMERLNKTADERTKDLVKNCPFVALLRYPQAWPVEVYMCAQ